ncbi:MAG: ubiquinol-cytochrome C chaperone family protein [Xanthobacteraceae bacterium]|nr:ubiquinol-cytochrome C chaperone family protein [Xanthobacteraceae bacterium]
MLWPFNRFGNLTQPQGALKGTIEAIYGMIVAQAREPAFYASLNVPDTVNGRFDMLLLHLWMVLHQLRTCDDGEALAQALFDHFCADMDDNLREMGVGDLTVPKRMQAFGEAFYGRTAAYDSALSAGETELAAAIGRNILNGEHADGAARIAAYVKQALAVLEPFGRDALLQANWHFPPPPKN